jgi:hypothetical protein
MRYIAFSLLLIISFFHYAQTISTSAIVGSPFCQNTAVSVPYTITGVYNPGNQFTAQLSDASGSFASPTTIGSVASVTAGSIAATLPTLLTTGTQYRIRVVSTNPVIIGSDNGSNLTINGNTTNPTTFGNNIWHAYCFNIASYTNNAALFNYSNYRGMYTENTINVNSTNFWAINSNPSTAAGYAGCPVTNDLHIVNYKRRGFPCGYYNISIAGPGNIAGHDDAGRLIVDGVVVWSSTGCCVAVPNVFTGFLGPNTEIEFVWSENGGQSYGRLTFTPISYPNVSSDVNICAGSSTTLTASGAANYDWSTNSTHLVAPLNNASVVVSPPGGTPNSIETYTVSTTDATTGCTVSNTVDVTINPLPSTSVTPTSGAYCAVGTVNALASGANTYTWSPLAGVTVNSVSGDNVTLSPATTTVYTVTGSNNCATNDATVTVTVTVPAGNPAVYGINTWNAYCYNGGNFENYFGMYVHNTLNFNTTSLWAQNSTPSNAAGYTGCPIPVDNHSVSYKRRGFDCGYYRLDITRDDLIQIIINGVSVYSAGCCGVTNNVWQGYLDNDSEVDIRLREAAGNSYLGATFNYLWGPNNSPNQTVWLGKISTDWFNVGNWCNGIPSSTIGAYIPANAPNMPIINAAGAVTNQLFIQQNATLTINGANTLDIHGDFTKNGTFTTNISTVRFSGSNTINVVSATNLLSFHNLELNNLSVGGIILGALNTSKITVRNNLNFINGIIYSNTPNFVEFNDNATATNTKDLSHINGQVRKIGNDAFEFPVGKGGFFRPIAISAPGNNTHHFTAEFFNSSPDAVDATNPAPMDPGFENISDCEYWILNRTNGGSTVFVTLSYRSYGANGCSGVADLSNLTITRWSGATWVNHPSTATILPSGTITTNAVVTAYSPFTLATFASGNPLPIELINFNAIPNGNSVDVSWQTASEINNDYFTVEKSIDGVNFEFVVEIDGAGNSTSQLSYSTVDENPYNGQSFYRLKQTDFDGSFEYSNPVVVNFNGGKVISIYPNPVLGNQHLFTVDCSNLKEIISSIQLVDELGRIVHQQSVSTNINQISISTENVGSGVYFVKVNTISNHYFSKVVIK